MIPPPPPPKEKSKRGYLESGLWMVAKTILPHFGFGPPRLKPPDMCRHHGLGDVRIASIS